MTNPGSDDPILDKALLTKADALIRRNRPDGVSSDVDELPLLTDAVDEDLPELTDTLLDIHALTVEHTPERPGPPPVIAPDFDLEDHTPTGQFQRLSPLPPREVIENAVDEAVERTRQEMLAEQKQAIQEAVTRARSEAFADAHAQQQRAVQAALAQGREEAEINQWPALQDARKEATESAAMAMSERLIELDAQIAQSINQWLAKELPSLVAGELLGLSERLRVQTAAHMRATLLPELSEQISRVLDSAFKNDEQR
ncbi:MAG: hypothetical protein H6R19_465 [Proteobacteria bacterium]|nr:hypothetical protein [Pseudomonadota bacterium]